MQSVIKGILFTILLGFFTVAVAHEVSADICTFSGGITAYRVSDKGDWFPAIVKCDEETIRVYAQKTNLLIARFGRDDTVRVGMDLTRFGCCYRIGQEEVCGWKNGCLWPEFRLMFSCIGT